MKMRYIKSITNTSKNNKLVKNDRSIFTKKRKETTAENQVLERAFELDQCQITKKTPVSLDRGATWHSRHYVY